MNSDINITAECESQFKEMYPGIAKSKHWGSSGNQAKSIYFNFKFFLILNGFD